MSEVSVQKNLQGTWAQALMSFLFPVLLVFSVRWALIEPYIIPSESMVPNLLINDHIIVQKFAYGVKLPFTKFWLLKWATPQHDDVIVFRYPENPDVFYVKRVIGLPGDKLQIKDGRVVRNGTPLIASHQLPVLENSDFSRYTEGRHFVHFDQPQSLPEALVEEFIVPEASYFMMGDNRDHSSDSRVWGFVPESFLVGKAWFIWISCEKTLESMTFLCDPSQLRWNRMFKTLDNQKPVP